VTTCSTITEQLVCKYNEF